MTNIVKYSDIEQDLEFEGTHVLKKGDYKSKKRPGLLKFTPVVQGAGEFKIYHNKLSKKLADGEAEEHEDGSFSFTRSSDDDEWE